MADIGSTLSKYTSASELSNLLESDKFGMISVKTYGATGDGVTDERLAFITACAIGLPVYVPSGSYYISDSTGIDERVLYGEGDVYTPTETLAVNKFHSAQKKTPSFWTGFKEKSQFLARKTWGTFQNAAGFAVQVGLDNPQVQVLGLTSDSQLATYPDRDSVALYCHNESNDPLYSSDSNVTYTANSVSTSVDITNYTFIQKGMIIDTNHSPKYSGIITGISASTITVSAWYLVGNVTPTTPTDGTGFVVSPITKIWGNNTNVILRDAHSIAACVGAEIGVLNYKTGATAWGVDVVNLGTEQLDIGFYVRKGGATPGNITRGFFAENATTSFESYQSAADMIAFYATVNGTANDWFVTSDGKQNKLRPILQSINDAAADAGVADVNKTGFIFNTTVDKSFVLSTASGRSGVMLFFTNLSATTTITLTGKNSDKIVTRSSDTSTTLQLPPRCGCVLMSDGSSSWLSIVESPSDKRSGSASPTGAVVPLYIGEEYLETTSSPKKWYKSTGLTNSDWVALN